MENLIELIDSEILPHIVNPTGIAIFKTNDTNYDIFVQKNNRKFVYYIKYNLSSYSNLYGVNLPINKISQFETDIKEVIQYKYNMFLEYCEFYLNVIENVSTHNIDHKDDEDIDFDFDERIDEYSEIAYDSYIIENFEKSLLYYDLAIEMNPYDANLYAGKGNCFIQQKKYKLALLEYCKGALTKPTDYRNIYKCQFLILLLFLL
ncbi:MAG: hypothetical protein IPF70_19075 [Saprospiraceae bacterium]|nr:hypothetical protein [Saprospiraceae bacterium]